MHLLLLEDNTSDAELTKIGLEESITNSRVVVCTSLKEARILLTNEHSFDCALLDMQLPDGTGLDMLMEIKLSGLELPVIMITGSGNEEVAIAVLKAGADDYVIKRQGYLDSLPDIIDLAIKNSHQKSRELKERIEVLYIERHAHDIELTNRHLSQQAPYIRLDHIASAEEALALLAKNDVKTRKYKVLLLDYHLPGINALEFIKIVRQEYKLTVPIIIVTGQGSEDVAIQALKLGANDYLVKRDNYLYRLPSMILNVYQHVELIKKQEELAQSESNYRLLADNSGDFIFVLDKDYTFSYISPAINSLLGYKPEEIIHQHFSSVLTTEAWNKAKIALNDILADNPQSLKPNQIQKTMELEMLCKDNTKVWTEVKATINHDQNHTNNRILGVTRDISARKTANDNLRKLSRTVEQSPASVIITNLDGNIEYINPKFAKITGYTFEEVKGKNPRILKSGKTSPNEYRQLWKTILAGGEWFGEFLNKKKDGSLFWESASISPIRDEEGQITHFLAVKEDITEKKKEHEELVAAKERAEESDRLKSAFLANMSHEIRTPMNGILGFSQLLKEPDLTGEEQKEYIAIIQKSGARMLNIINDIVDISKIESGQMSLNLSRTNINDQLKFIYDFFKTEAGCKDIQLTYTLALPDAEAIIQTDREKLYAILTNLVKNAIKYTNNGYIELGYELKTTLTDQIGSSDFIHFYVKDSGIGIPEDRQTAIFDRFIQADITDIMARQGAGLGLSISKAYVEMLGGKIWVESELGKGSSFHFTLPTNKK